MRPPIGALLAVLFVAACGGAATPSTAPAPTATANPTWRFADFGMTAPSVPFRVVSLVDEIKVVVDLVATAKG